MKILPAIDLINGKCVRLYQGDFSKTEQVGSDPKTQIKTFLADGAEIIHIVDLDGAREGSSSQFELIRELCNIATVPIQVGGGVRNMETLEKLINVGVQRVVIGTAAIEDQDFLKEALRRFQENVVIGIDAKNEMVATRGWETLSEAHYIDFAKEMEALGVKTIVYTDISRDGTMTGPNLEQLKKLNEAVSCKIVASGGIKSNQDLVDLDNIGITEAIVGKAIYEGKVTLSGDLS
ncbi:1-(5-phosphoribosyl)-5-[(5-phosphoribosylamino)methylideneamino]imidazole-4-carboxamide isomerase [Saliterribacillus persicus]|uniref:1-(5-phosphoribosyl)-5-[(5-phosphoribosylamino)methylideneamino] imidazole-4-carboxamide isomerase n=1 Tax=Saliterribacillus persicus TaxID=930114 RepID=A0A368XBF8_9BACI|nr:1-(5-phosphoribosyl)-5-[(5-phosphoribosylamino)methylideneamino]imidazole-4-carboxamide isomerase [Saliterribacillus persicus]RCW63767.1 1-(5-phosphoribosyl)-5-[(5-phosphoribosylamino)methylideneamino] imidazole-4-carboxamide isomerase [Saliterribacillus persicus]